MITPMRGVFRVREKANQAAARHERLLAISVGGLAACVLSLMFLSLAGCEMFSSSSGGKPAAGVATTGTAKAPAKHVAPAAPGYPLSGISAEPDTRVRIGLGLSEALIANVPIGWKPPAATPTSKAGTSPPSGSNTAFGSATVFIEPIGSGVRARSASSRGGAVAVPGPVRVVAPQPGSGEWLITDGAGQSQQIMADSLEFSTNGTDAGSTLAAGRLITLGDLTYPGRLRLIARSDTPSPSFDVVEHVPLEVYLRGVVVKEMYPNWPLEAFRVQAICARTYALHERIRAGVTGKPYDVEASQRDQAYSGATSNPRAIEAVDSTRGLVLTSQGNVLRAYYSSSCGGRTGAARDTWPTGPGFEYNLALPIQAYQREFLCDKSSPQFTWAVTRDREELVKRLRAYGDSNGMLIRKIENIASLEVLRAAPTGRPAEYKIIEPGGRWFQMKAEDMRLACNYGVANVPATTSKDRVLSGDITFKIIPPKNAGTGTNALKTKGGTVEITGRGFGHGVGMCQYCTKAMAERGDDWRAMLMRFYPGADLVRAYK